MILQTIIARLGDGLALAASVQDDEQVLRNTAATYQNQAKRLCRTLNASSEQMGSILSEPYFFHYLIDRGVIYLALCEKQFNKSSAFAYLQDLAQEFANQNGHKVETVRRPYAFVEFDNYIVKARRIHCDSRLRSNLTGVNRELQDVQRIMVKNINDVLERGDHLSKIDQKAQQLSDLAKGFKKDAHMLNLRSGFAKVVALILIVVFLLLAIRFWWF